jgi:hypothetical protein
MRSARRQPEPLELSAFDLFITGLTSLSVISVLYAITRLIAA